jgi:hypothetical protein
LIAKHGRAPTLLTTPLFGLDSVMIHRGQHPSRSYQSVAGPVGGWDRLRPNRRADPVIAATMYRCLDQPKLSLCASSVASIEITLQQLAGRLTATGAVTTVAGIRRAQIESNTRWLASRPGYRKNTQVSKAPI